MEIDNLLKVTYGTYLYAKEVLPPQLLELMFTRIHDEWYIERRLLEEPVYVDRFNRYFEDYAPEYEPSIYAFLMVFPMLIAAYFHNVPMTLCGGFIMVVLLYIDYQEYKRRQSDYYRDTQFFYATLINIFYNGLYQEELRSVEKILHTTTDDYNLLAMKYCNQNDIPASGEYYKPRPVVNITPVPLVDRINFKA